MGVQSSSAGIRFGLMKKGGNKEFSLVHPIDNNTDTGLAGQCMFGFSSEVVILFSLFSVMSLN